MEIALLIFAHAWNFGIGFFGAYMLMAKAKVFIDFVPYEWVQFRNPERLVYFLAGGFYCFAGYQIFEKHGTIPSDFLAFSAGAVTGLAHYWLYVLPNLELEDDHESMITFGDPWKK